MLTRFLPFLIFPEGRKPPKYITYLGTVLPCAVIALLVVYCLRDVVFTDWHGLPEFLAIAFIVFLHRWRKNTLLSIAGGTVFYMLLVHVTKPLLLGSGFVIFIQKFINGSAGEVLV